MRENTSMQFGYLKIVAFEILLTKFQIYLALIFMFAKV